MSRRCAPPIAPSRKPSRGFPAGNLEAVSTALGWRLVNPRMPEEWTVSLGEANEQLAEKFDVSRERQDEWGVSSQNRAEKAIANGFFEREIASELYSTSGEYDLLMKIYVEPDADDLHASMNTVERPLNALGETDLCPGSAALDKINAALR